MHVLTDKEFHSTICEPMKNITGSDLLVDIWEYADRIIEADYHEFQEWDWKVGFIYETGDGRYQHISIAVPRVNTYLVLVLALDTLKFYGHYVLDLGKKYGLVET